MNNDLPGRELASDQQWMLVLGVGLMGGGGFIMAYMAYLAFRVLRAPSEVPLVHFLLERANVTDPALRGVLNGAPLEISLSSGVLQVIYLFLGVLILSIIAGFGARLFSGGMSLLRLYKGIPEIAPYSKRSD